MLFFVVDGNDPASNLALEELLTRELTEELFFFWQNHNAIIIGRNQNTLAEINRDYVDDHAIQVVRRVTGGGAVYHDMGNINYSYITNGNQNTPVEFERFARPVIESLGELGVQAEFSGRNDILIDGKKISGSAQSFIGNRILFHGTLLFASNLSVLGNALIADPEKIAAKGVKSIRSRVTNISEHLPAPLNVQEFINVMSSHIKERFKIAADTILPPDILARAESLANEKYRTWAWNYGSSPQYQFNHTKRFAAGRVNLSLDIRHGLIEELKFTGDFFGSRPVAELELHLRQTPQIGRAHV